MTVSTIRIIGIDRERKETEITKPQPKSFQIVIREMEIKGITEASSKFKSLIITLRVTNSASTLLS